MKKTIWAAAAAMLMAVPATARAQDTPEQAVDRYLSTLKAQDWAGNAAVVNPPELDSLKAAFIDVASADTSTAGLRALFNVGTAAELRALAAPVVYQRFIAATMGQQEQMQQFLRVATFRVLGHVGEGDTAYVVYRVSAAAAGGQQTSQVTVMTAVRAGGQWKARLSEELRGTVVSLHTAAAQRRAARQAVEAGAQPRPPASGAPVRPGAPPPSPTPTRP